MTTYINTNERYGFSGPFEAESKQELIDGMLPTFTEWANDEYNKIEDPEMTRDEYLSSAIADMQNEFEDALEIVVSTKHSTLQDAHTALINSGVIEMFDHADIQLSSRVVEWMYRNDKSPEQAAEHFGVAE